MSTMVDDVLAGLPHTTTSASRYYDMMQIMDKAHRDGKDLIAHAGARGTEEIAQAFRQVLDEIPELNPPARMLVQKIEGHGEPVTGIYNPQILAARQKSYLVNLARSSYVERSAHAAGVNGLQVRVWRKKYPWFGELETLALNAYAERLEAVADERAINGWEEPVFGKLEGKDTGTGQVGTTRKYDHNLLMFRLRALLPDKYAERKRTELTGAEGGPVQIQPVIDVLKERLDRIRARAPVLPVSSEQKEPESS